MKFYTPLGEPVDHKSQFEEQPFLDKQFVKINDNCLYTTGHSTEQSILLGWMSIWMFWVLFFPFLIYLAYMLFHNTLSNIDNLVYDAMFFIFNILFVTSFTLGFAWILIRNIKKTSLYCFNRKKQKICAVIKGQRYEADWQTLKAEFTSVTRIYGPNPVSMEVTKLQLFANNDPEESAVAMIPESDSSDNSGDGNKMVWEFLRQFMNKGPDNLPLIAKYELSKDMNHGKISYTFQEALLHRSFWPIYNKIDKSDIKFTQIVLFPFKLVFFIPNILTDILWHKMVTSMKAHRRDDDINSKECGNQWVTPGSIGQVLQPGEKMITYAEAKKRGALR